MPPALPALSTLPTLKDLPPRWARFCLGIAAFAEKELGLGFARKHCIVACSGGADSTALLLIAAMLCRKEGGFAAAAHVDHGLRAASGEDAAFVSSLCEKWNIPCLAERIDVQALAEAQGLGLEEAGRNARYAFLEGVRSETGAELILLGHQLNDLAEDQLMRLARGSGWPALGGMAGHDPQRRILRPLLLTPRAQLEEFLKAAGTPWRTDASNADDAFMRNRVRRDMLPLLERENPAYLDAAARLWRQARLDEVHFESETALALASCERGEKTSLLLPEHVLKGASAPLRLRVFKAALERLGPGQVLSDGLFRLEALWREHANGRAIRFPGDKEARIMKSGVAFRVIDRKKECG